MAPTRSGAVEISGIDGRYAEADAVIVTRQLHHAVAETRHRMRLYGDEREQLLEGWRRSYLDDDAVDSFNARWNLGNLAGASIEHLVAESLRAGIAPVPPAVSTSAEARA